MSANLARFSAFANEVVHQWHEWGEFEHLFFGPKARVALLNKTAKHFFGELFYAQLDRIILGVARLTDSPNAGSGGGQSLTLWSVHHEYAAIQGYPRASFGAVATSATLARTHIAKWRNKRIAHTDAAVAMGKKSVGQVMPVTLRHFYESCGAYINDLSEALGQGPFPIDTVAQYGVADLIQALKLAAAVRDDETRDMLRELELLRASKYSDA